MSTEYSMDDYLTDLNSGSHFAETSLLPVARSFMESEPHRPPRYLILGLITAAYQLARESTNLPSDDRLVSFLDIAYHIGATHEEATKPQN